MVPCSGCGRAAVLAVPTNFCDPSYECQFSAVSKEGVEFDYDLSTLCASGPNGVDYQVRLLLPVGIPAGASP